MILISQTFEVVTPESAEDGDAAERGFVFENEPHSFRELVELMREHPVASSSPLRAAGAWDWFTSYDEPNYRTGAARSTSIHYARSNNPRALKYWNKAARAAGLLH